MTTEEKNKIVSDFQNMSEAESAVRLTMQSVHDIEVVYATLTDQSVLAAVFPYTDPCHVWLTPRDLAVFRKIVSTNALTAARFQGPNGYKILDFLTLLYEMQQRRYAEIAKAERDELNAIYKKHQLSL